MSERSTYTDPTTGATVTQWTTAPCTNQHLYFTSFSVTTDDRWLTCISDRDGHPNLYVIDRRDGAIRRLSDNRQGLLRGYVYPQGGRVGFAKASPCLDAERNQIYYIRNEAVHAVGLDDGPARERHVCDLPTGWYSAFTHISPNGQTLCVPLADPRAFELPMKTQWEQMRIVPQRMAQQNMVTRIMLIDVTTGATRIAAEVPFWVSHVQFDPTGTGRIIFNKEGQWVEKGRPLPDRIWCLEPDGRFRTLAPEAPEEWRSHENWAPDGRSILYHGVRDGRAFGAARTWEGELLHESDISGLEFYHAIGALDGKRMFVDRRNGMISLLDPFATGNRMIDLCRHDTTFDCQDAHAHPMTTPKGESVIFTSIRTGHCQVYEVTIPPELR